MNRRARARGHARAHDHGRVHERDRDRAHAAHGAHPIRVPSRLA